MRNSFPLLILNINKIKKTNGMVVIFKKNKNAGI